MCVGNNQFINFNVANNVYVFVTVRLPVCSEVGHIFTPVFENHIRNYSAESTHGLRQNKYRTGFENGSLQFTGMLRLFYS